MSCSPNYKRIYEDIIMQKCPERIQQYRSILEKEKLSVLDIIELEKKIFGISDRKTDVFNQSHRSYNTSTILKILEYQKKHKCNNSQLAIHFKLSRNTVTKWKRLFSV
ncbi:hypothetical protein SAMN05880573_11637 [Chryseobacterium sp. RU33C]|jgi:hypothetical protein|nr:transposase [Chryseobacterium sp.]SIR11654.1 hypothetical protein SAMN05880573_11637 [Chryseobacterium sp. RU33C]